MYKPLIATLITAMLAQAALADTCPSIKDIRSNKITGWRGFDSDDHKPLTSQRMAHLLKTADQFVLAEWSEKQNKLNTIRCYYRDKNGSDVDMYLSKNSYTPENTHLWYQVSGAKHCAAGMSDCKFKPIKLQARLAQK